MTLNDLQVSGVIAGLINYDFSQSCAVVDKILTDIARRAVPLRQLSFLRKLF